MRAYDAAQPRANPGLQPRGAEGPGLLEVERRGEHPRDETEVVHEPVGFAQRVGRVQVRAGVVIGPDGQPGIARVEPVRDVQGIEVADPLGGLRDDEALAGAPERGEVDPALPLRDVHALEEGRGVRGPEEARSRVGHPDPEQRRDAPVR